MVELQENTFPETKMQKDGSHSPLSVRKTSTYISKTEKYFSHLLRGVIFFGIYKNYMNTC